MRTSLFTVALLIFIASAHAAGPAPHAVECKPNIAQIDGHEVATACEPKISASISDWRKDGKLDRADGPALIVRDIDTDTVIDEAWFKDGKEIAPPRTAAR